MLRKNISLVSLFIFFTCSPLTAQECSSTESLDACFERIAELTKNEAIKRETAKRSDAISESITQKTTSAPTLSTASSLTDLLPQLLTAYGFGNEDSDGNLVVQRSLAKNLTFKAVALVDPKVFKPLLDAIPEDARSTQETKLQETLEDFKNVDLSLSYNFQFDHGPWQLGRDVSDYQNLFSGFLTDMVDNASPGPASPTELERLETIQYISSNYYRYMSVDSGVDLSESSLDEVENALKKAIIKKDNKGEGDAEKEARRLIELAKSKTAAAAKEFGHTEKSITEQLKTGNFNELKNLINNQPQLIFNLTYKDREDLAGPDDFRGKLTYEHGFDNIRTFQKWAKKKNSGCVLDRNRPTYGCLNDYLKDHPAGEKGHRVAFSLEYTDIDPFRAELADVQVPMNDDSMMTSPFVFNLEASEKWIGSLTYGRYIDIEELGKENARIDIEAKYEDVSGDPMRQSRFVATATLTANLPEGIVASVSAVYANKPEYLGQVDEEISAHFGFRWKLDRTPSTASP